MVPVEAMASFVPPTYTLKYGSIAADHEVPCDISPVLEAALVFCALSLHTPRLTSPHGFELTVDDMPATPALASRRRLNHGI